MDIYSELRETHWTKTVHETMIHGYRLGWFHRSRNVVTRVYKCYFYENIPVDTKSAGMYHYRYHVPKDKPRVPDYKTSVNVSITYHAGTVTRSTSWETGTMFGVKLQEPRQEGSQRDVRAYARSTSRSAATEQNKSSVTDHIITLNHVVDWDQAKVIERESNKMDRWIKEAIYRARQKKVIP